MLKFLSHEALGKGILSTGYSSGQNAMESWADQLTNPPGDPKIAPCPPTGCENMLRGCCALQAWNLVNPEPRLSW